MSFRNIRTCVSVTIQYVYVEILFFDISNFCSKWCTGRNKFVSFRKNPTMYSRYYPKWLCENYIFWHKSLLLKIMHTKEYILSFRKIRSYVFETIRNWFSENITFWYKSPLEKIDNFIFDLFYSDSWVGCPHHKFVSFRKIQSSILRIIQNGYMEILYFDISRIRTKLCTEIIKNSAFIFSRLYEIEFLKISLFDISQLYT